MLRAVLILISLCGSPAAAQEPPSAGLDVAQEADLHFRLGSSAYRSGRYQDALEHLLLSNRLAPNRNVVFNIARAYEQLGQFDQAFRHYSDYVAAETDPDRRANGERALDRIRPRVALVRVSSQPEGARVYVDRVDLGARGTTPITLALQPGEHTVIAQLEDHREDRATRSLVTGQRVDADLSLTPILGTVALSGSPEGATVRLSSEEGPELGTLPGDLLVPPGSQNLVISAPGYRTATHTIQVEPDSTQAASVDLELVTGTLVVDALERGALVSIDGEPVGFTPAVLPVAVGEHSLTVSMPGSRPFEQVIRIEDDASLTVEATLRSLREVSAATRSARSIDEVPASVTLVGAREIRAFGYQNLYQALSNVRGVFPTNDLTYQYLGFRGFSTPGDYGNRVLVTVDGHTMNDDQLGASYVGTDFMTDLEDVQQVEVVRGPGSALYGSNAFFGVINVVTHDGDTRPRPHVKVTADAERTLRARAGAGFGDAERGGWVSAAGLTAQGRDYVFEEFAGIPRGNETGAALGADATQARTLHGRVWLGDLELQAFHHGREKSIPTGAFGTRLADPRAHSDDYRSFGEARWSPRFDRVDVDVRAWLDAYSYEGAFPYGPNSVWVDTWDGMWAGTEPRLVARPTDFLILTAGAETRQHFSASLTTFEYANPNLGELADDEPINSESPTFAVYSGYAIAEVVAGDFARISAGGRVDAFDTAAAIDDDVTTFNPRLALVLAPTDKDVVKLMGGTAFRAPSVYEYLYDDGGLTQVEPENLEPETVLTAEAELTHRFDDVTALTVAGYHNRINRLVDTEVLGGGVFRYANLPSLTQTVGLEAELRRDWQQGWMAAVQHSAQQTRVGDLLDGREVVNSPPHVFGLKGAMPLTGADATLAGVLRSESPRRMLGGGRTAWAHLVDLTLTGDVPRLDTEWSVGVRNLLDWRQEHPTGADLRMRSVPQPGRAAFASLRTAW